MKRYARPVNDYVAAPRVRCALTSATVLYLQAKESAWPIHPTAMHTTNVSTDQAAIVMLITVARRAVRATPSAPAERMLVAVPHNVAVKNVDQMAAVAHALLVATVTNHAAMVFARAVRSVKSSVNRAAQQPNVVSKATRHPLAKVAIVVLSKVTSAGRTIAAMGLAAKR